MDTPYGRTYWVKPGRFLAGAYPDALDETGRIEKLRAILGFGITHFINLMDWDEQPVINRDFVGYEDLVAGLSRGRVRAARFPIPVGGVPEQDEMVRVLDYIDLLIASGKSLFLHSFSGRGRVGLVVGCWLIRHGIADSDTVFDRIAELRKNEATAPLRSPQTGVQEAFVRSWQRNL